MKKLLSLPPNLVECYHDIENASKEEWFCTSDPIGARVGSGGGTTHLLRECWKSECKDLTIEEWLPSEKRVLIHAGGQGRRVPAYAPSGKILTPIPVFRWMRGQSLKQNLLSLQVPLYEQILNEAPDIHHTLVACGDAYIRCDENLPQIPNADVVCLGMWVDADLATKHGVFVVDRKNHDTLDYMLQKPSISELGHLLNSHLFMMDLGIWLLSDKAVKLLMKNSTAEDGESICMYDLYSEFGLSIGENPRIKNEELSELSVAVLPLSNCEFYHFGTNKELISSTLTIQNLVKDQHKIMQRDVKIHPSIFLQNCDVNVKFTAFNLDLWIENSCIGAKWHLNNKHIITGVPRNDWELNLPAQACVDIIPIDENMWVVRPYGFDDAFSGCANDKNTTYLSVALQTWLSERCLSLDNDKDIQNLDLFAICNCLEDVRDVLHFMINDADYKRGKDIWISATRLSANEISDKANLRRLVAQRQVFRNENWSALAKNHHKSVFYQIDLNDAAIEFVENNIVLPNPLDEGEDIIKRINDQMFRARVLQLKGEEWKVYSDKAFGLLREGLISTIQSDKNTPKISVAEDQIVWARSPVRIDLAGGWTDTPPFCIFNGGNVVNVAIELNGQPPLQVYIKPSQQYNITLRSIDMSAMEIIRTWEELEKYNVIRSPFSIPKAALSLAGFSPKFCGEKFDSLEEQLRSLGFGFEITLSAAIPAGSGLGTSSVLSATVLGAISDFCSLGWDKNEIGLRTLVLEQLLTSGGGWQDQFGGLLNGVKLLQTSKGFLQQPLVRWLPEHIFTSPEYKNCHLLYYTGITRTAKDILSDIVQGMFLNSERHLEILREINAHALDMHETIMKGNFDNYGRLIKKTWEQNVTLNSNTISEAAMRIIDLIKDFSLGYRLCGAGKGGYMYIVAKDPVAAQYIRKVLTENPINSSSRFVELSLSTTGFQVTRS